jgi:hypothetical protein
MISPEKVNDSFERSSEYVFSNEKKGSAIIDSIRLLEDDFSKVKENTDVLLSSKDLQKEIRVNKDSENRTLKYDINDDKVESVSSKVDEENTELIIQEAKTIKNLIQEATE